MIELPGFSSRAEPEARRFDFFFDRLDTCLRKGRGFSLFQADAACVRDFSEGCERRGLTPLAVQLSAIQSGLAALPAWPASPASSASPPFVLLIQDLSYADFLDQASLIADRLVFPLWFRRIPICFFSSLGREAYESQPLKGEDLHRDVSRAIRALLADQILTLLERSNYQFASPELLDPIGPMTLFTPLEEKMRAALEAHNLSYQPQVRLGRQVVDFLVPVGVQNSKVIVECESNAHHEPSKDPERDAPRGRPLAGYAICRFSGSEYSRKL